MYTPSFSITNTILKHIGTIEAAKEVIEDAPLLPLWEKRFREDAIIRTAHHGTHIEGNKLDLSQAKEVLQGNDVVGRPRDVQEVINYRMVLDLLESEVERKVGKVTEQLIRKIHKIVVKKILDDDQSGEYRSKHVVIRNSETGEITFKPPAPAEVPFLMREFVYWLNKTTEDDMHPVLKAAVAHHEFVRIHPFIDGNGRVGRATATLVMYIGGYDIRRFFSLEEYYDKDAESYYSALQKASGGNLTAWLEYFTLGVAMEFDRIKKRIHKLSKDTYLKEKLGGKQVFITDRQTAIIEYIQSIGYLQNKSFGELMKDVSEDTVLRDLKDLIDKGIIKKVGKTKAARYEMV
ncbi:MAG: Fic family protein [Candidatus Roizmanbacteria bacterium]